LSNRAAPATELLCVVWARPTAQGIDRSTVTEPNCTKATPSSEYDAVKVLPERCSFSQRGATPGADAATALCPLICARYCRLKPLPGVTIAKTCLAPGSKLSRNMSPDFAHS